MTGDELRQEIEMNVVDLLNARLEEGSMTDARSQEISQYVLDMLKPGMSFEEILLIIPKLDDRAPELSTLVLPVLREYEQTVALRGKENVQELIRQGQYDAAAKLAQKVISRDVGPTWVGSGKPEA